jgi:hypothetical protein
MVVSHGGRWKKPISRYIETISPKGRELGRGAQRGIKSPALIQAMMAKVGVAARQSQSVAVCVDILCAIVMGVVIFGSPLVSRPWPVVRSRD